MTLHDVSRLVQYANKNPPLRVLVMGCATALGVKFEDPAAKKSKYLTAEELRAIVQTTGGRIPGMSGGPGG